MNVLAETHGLVKRYGDEAAVNGIDLGVPEGAVYGFLGPNGAGKTTTLKMLLGLVRPSEGEIYLHGRQMNEKNRLELLREVGSLIETPSYYGHLTARENLEIVRALRGLSPESIDQALETVRLEHTGRKTVAKFSLGMKQRLGIAAAIMGRPRLLLLDEPTNGLDPAGIQEMRQLIRSLPERFGMTVVISSHLLGEIDQVADYVGIIRRGEMVFQDSLHALHVMSGSSLALRTDDNIRAAGLLSARLDGDYILLPSSDDAEAAELSRRLCGEGIGIIRMELREERLEDIFLSMTGTEAEA